MEKSKKQVELFLYKEEAGKERLYLLLHRVPAKGGFWQPMTGGNHLGESLEQTVRREALEELGIVINSFSFTDYSFTFRDNDKDYVEYVYGAEVPANTAITLSLEHDEYRWVTYNEAQRLLKWETNKAGLDALEKLIAG